MDFKILSTKDKIVFSLIGLVIVAIVGAIIYFGGRTPEITEPVEITAEQKAKVETQIAELNTKLENCNEQSEENKCSNLYLQLAVNYESLGLVSKAIAAYYNAADANVNSYVPYSNLGSIYRRLKDYAKAEESFRQALRITPNNPAVYTKLIEMSWYDQKQSPDKVDPLFQEAFKATNYDTNLIRLYAFYGKSINDPLTEIAAWKSIVQLEPDNAQAKAELAAATKKAKEQGLIE